MTSTEPTLSSAPAEDPVTVALSDPDVHKGLAQHAGALLAMRWARRPIAVRHEGIQEALQNLHVRALEKRTGYDGDTGPVRAWLHGVLNLVLCEMVRAELKQPIQPPEKNSDWEKLTPVLRRHAGETVPDQLAVAEYLAQLPLEHRQILQLRYYEELSHKELASRLGISAGNARVKLCRALAALKDIAGIIPQEGER